MHYVGILYISNYILLYIYYAHYDTMNKARRIQANLICTLKIVSSKFRMTYREHEPTRTSEKDAVKIFLKGNSNDEREQLYSCTKHVYSQSNLCERSFSLLLKYY